MNVAQGMVVPISIQHLLRYVDIDELFARTKIWYQGISTFWLGNRCYSLFCVGSFECTEHNFVKASLFI